MPVTTQETQVLTPVFRSYHAIFIAVAVDGNGVAQLGNQGSEAGFSWDYFNDEWSTQTHVDGVPDPPQPGVETFSLSYDTASRPVATPGHVWLRYASKVSFGFTADAIAVPGEITRAWIEYTGDDPGPGGSYPQLFTTLGGRLAAVIPVGGDPDQYPVGDIRSAHIEGSDGMLGAYTNANFPSVSLQFGKFLQPGPIPAEHVTYAVGDFHRRTDRTHYELVLNLQVTPSSGNAPLAVNLGGQLGAI